MKLMVGADPEWFLTDGKNPVSAIGKIGGTKFKPAPVKGLPHGFFLQEDNVTVEYNIPPATSQHEWVVNHQKIQKIIKDKVKPLGLKPLIVGSVEMPQEELQDPRAWIFGCEPDFNAWSLKPNPAPMSENKFLRAAGGHVHIAFEGNKLNKIEFVRILDLCIGLPLMVHDQDNRRMELYGKAGAFRYKDYGIEYRTPSNFWTKSEVFIHFIWLAVAQALNLFNSNFRASRKVQEIFDSRDRKEAVTYLNSLGIYIP